MCDTSQPGGYCTVFNCEPGTCPDDSVCVSFHNSASGSFCSEIADRFQRPFCMAPCSGDGDCRGGYSCVKVGTQANLYGAVVIEHGEATANVCLATQSIAEPDAGESAVCSGEKGGTPPEPLGDAGTFIPDAAPSDAAVEAGDSGAAGDAGDAGDAASGS